MTRLRFLALLLCILASSGPRSSVVSAQASTDTLPKMLAYSAFPNGYFNAKAANVAQLYDRLFFNVGSWDDGVRANLSFARAIEPTSDWKVKVRENLFHLRNAGVTENLLAVSFGSSAPWPSPETLLLANWAVPRAHLVFAV